MKAVKQKLQETNPDRVGEFEKGAQAFAKKIVSNFKDYEFYTGENMNPEGMVALLNYREDGVTRKACLVSQRWLICASILYVLEAWPQGGQALSLG